jgi:hypothetical protein
VTRPDLTLEEAAHHEAGHAVVAHALHVKPWKRFLS